MRVTNKLVVALSAMALMAGAASAERYVMVTHGEGKDPFWPVVQKGGEDAARHIGADFEYVYTPSADMGDMAKMWHLLQQLRQQVSPQPSQHALQRPFKPTQASILYCQLDHIHV